MCLEILPARFGERRMEKGSKPVAVTADANGRVNELRRKPSTSPAAYSTEARVPSYLTSYPYFK